MRPSLSLASATPPHVARDRGDAHPTRRAALAGAAALAMTAMLPAPTHADPAPDAVPMKGSVRDRVVARAQSLAAEPYRPVDTALPRPFAGLDYDAYRRIETRNERGLWRDGPGGFEVQPLHRGFIYPGTVELNMVEDGRVTRVPYDPGRFVLDGIEAPAGDIGHSGARLLAERGVPPVAREFAVFQGASYFRALAAGLTYGLSARGLAIGTGDARGEEFPDFCALWFERPDPGADHIVVHALLDGPSVAGAYTFTILPATAAGGATRMGVNVALFPRRDLAHVGLAPLTSMYWYGPLERGAADDYRPRVHDSDGLLACTAGGEWLWRPLANPRRVQTSRFDTGGAVHGFGLVQRTRDPEAFEDLEADYHLRPSAWVEPHAEWPAGAVELIEIPTDNEFNDNVVAYWRPDAPLAAGVRHDVGYDVVWCDVPDGGVGLLRATSTRSGAWGDGRQVVIDFDPPGTSGAPTGDAPPPPDPHALDAEVSTGTGTVDRITLQRHPGTGGLRLSFLFTPRDDAAELRARIVQAGRPVSETWLYRWTAS